ncbi:MAG: SRPBCC family protein [Deltaproteobacteria bacterium]|nr:SRPBCC family protein [Deltaproteobacteria bacterium]
MATIYKEIDLPVSPEALWEKVAGVGEVHKFMPVITDCRIEDDRRFCTMADGAKLEEIVLGVDKAKRRVAYTITKSPFPFDFHSASMQVVPNGKNARLIWITDLKPDALAEQMESVLNQVAQSLQQKFSR